MEPRSSTTATALGGSFGRPTTPLDFGIEWNAEDQLKRVTKDTVEVVRFAYDPKGRRVEKLAGGVTTTYFYDSEDILKQVTSGVVLRYVHGLDFDEAMAAENGAGQLTYEHADGLGSELKNTDSTGAVAFSRSYDAFGQLQAGASSSGYAFTGREWEPETGLYYYRARYYDAKLGRFASEDPLRFGAGVNFYAYVLNRPTTWIDPFGLQWWAKMAPYAKGGTRIPPPARGGILQRPSCCVPDATPSQQLRYSNQVIRALGEGTKSGAPFAAAQEEGVGIFGPPGGPPGPLFGFAGGTCKADDPPPAPPDPSTYCKKEVFDPTTGTWFWIGCEV